MDKLKRSSLLVAVFTLLLSSCTQKEPSLLPWLHGSWQKELKQSSKASIYEDWKQVGDTLLGISYRKSDGDSMLLEDIKLYFIGDTLVYAPWVYDQNGGERIVFKGKSAENGFVVSNAQHDFPSSISYTLKKDLRSLEVEISGMMGDSVKSIPMNFSKVKP